MEQVSTQELIEREVASLPEDLQREVYNFARFLREQATASSFNGLLLSECALNQEWNTPEEDAIWANL